MPVGLDSIIVEKYYVSDLADKAQDVTGGVLPINSVTYRIYVDMKPGYKFEAAYGVDVAPTGLSAGDHELRIATTTLFFNNEDRGNIDPTVFTKSQASHNTVMLDSWLSVGAAASGQFGVLKADDNGVNNQVNTDGILLNNNVDAGIPLTTQDGYYAGTPEAMTTIGITSEIAMFNNQNTGTNGPIFSTYNGSWASLNGSVGPLADNKVLIAQITTNGVFSFKLNIQLGTPTPGGVENWVADSPVGNEGTHPTLTYMDSLHSTSVAPIRNNNVSSFTVYPNPVNESLTISVHQSTQGADNSYTVYSIDGKAVATKKFGSVYGMHFEQVDVSGLAPGIYFVEVTLDGVRSTRKITKN